MDLKLMVETVEMKQEDTLILVGEIHVDIENVQNSKTHGHPGVTVHVIRDLCIIQDLLF